MKEDILLGIERLKSYENKSEHYRNLNLIGEITPKIALLELILRNLLDFYLSEVDEAWIFADEFKDFRKDTLKKYKNKDLSKYQYLSNLTLGKVVKAIKTMRLQSKLANVFDTKNFDLKSLSSFNENKILINSKTLFLYDFAKINIILNLFVNLRNRSFHFENLYKMEENKPRLTTTYKSLVVSLEAGKIEFFLDYFINKANEKFIKKIKENSL